MPQLKQPKVITMLEKIAQFNGYQTTTRKQDKAHHAEEKKFLPDLTAVKGKNGKRVFEVEATVTNQTIYKSLFSLLTALKNGKEEAFLVVPRKKIEFAKGCLENVHSVMKHFATSARGARRKVKLSILSFDDVRGDYVKIENYEKGGNIGQPPKCQFLPRPK